MKKKDLNNQLTFPKEGCCKITRELWNLIKFDLKYNPNANVYNEFKDNVYIKWFTNSIGYKVYTYINIESTNVENYTIEELNQFINIKNKKNEIPNITSEITRNSGSGTVILRCGGQQITTGSRPKGNTTRANTGTTRINHIKISKSIVKRENY